MISPLLGCVIRRTNGATILLGVVFTRGPRPGRVVKLLSKSDLRTLVQPEEAVRCAASLALEYCKDSLSRVINLTLPRPAGRDRHFRPDRKASHVTA